MLTLLTGNPAKYAPLGALLDQLQIAVRTPEFPVPEIQADGFLAVLAHKAEAAAAAFGGPCLVDDAGLLLDDYPGFPGPMTRSVCKLLGAAGLERLVAGTSARGKLVCHLGCQADGRLWHWRGEVAGTLRPRPLPIRGPGPLTDWFVPDEPGEAAVFLHRRRALEALAEEIEDLRRAIGGGTPAEPLSCPTCVFCTEFDGSRRSVFHEMTGGQIPSRIVRRTPHFLVLPPLGEFVEGGLLLATCEHRLSMACLPPQYYDELEELMDEIDGRLLRHYGCRPLFFEHAPAAAGDKGTCCVDHAHFNVFPVQVDVHAHLAKSPHAAVSRMCELSAPEIRDRPYLFLQDNGGRRFVYHADVVPSQYVRRIVTAELGMPDRWHWRDYLGLDELRRTMATLGDWR